MLQKKDEQLDNELDVDVDMDGDIDIDMDIDRCKHSCCDNNENQKKI